MGSFQSRWAIHSFVLFWAQVLHTLAFGRDTLGALQAQKYIFSCKVMHFIQ